MSKFAINAFYHQLLDEGVAVSTRRAHHRDEAYFWNWVFTHKGLSKHYPINTQLLIEFILIHLQGVNGKVLRVTTLRRYLASLSYEHNKRGVLNTCRDEQVKLLLRRAKVAQKDTPIKKKAITPELLNRLIASCDDSFKGKRDKALLLVAFGSGGRRRAELSNLLIEDLTATHNGYQLLLRHSKTDQTSKGKVVPVLGDAAEALTAWLDALNKTEGFLFRAIDRHNNIGQRISGHSINSIVKGRLELIGVDSTRYGAHSLRAGFMTAACNKGIALPVAMSLSGHSSYEVAASYYRDTDITQNPAAYLLGAHQ